jgi:hypothetical protein
VFESISTVDGVCRAGSSGRFEDSEQRGGLMVRRYDEVIEVRETSASGPDHFLWRGRIYAVRSVLGHWRERRAWWLEGATARLLGLDPTSAQVAEGPDAADAGDAGDAGDATDARDATEESARVADVLEREIWRVEAGAGRSGVVGVYDLGRDVVEPGAHWRLLQVAD